MNVTKLFALLLVFRLAIFTNAGTANRKHYIVYMGGHKHPNSESVVNANHEMLASVIGSYEGAKNVAVHHYTKSFRGFSAMLTPDEAQKLAESDSIVSVFESRINKLQTTQSWNFLNMDSIPHYNQLPEGMKSDVIVGVIDSGVWPESKSFSDYGLGPVPTTFRGKCETGEMFTISNCNRKIVGARFYYKGYEAEEGPLESANQTFFRSPRDDNGHGTHTASTIAGAPVSNVSLFGEAKGTARGGAPAARLAIYKACWFNDCADADILSAIDDAINDGVHILSISLGPTPPEPSFFENAVSIGTFHAFQKGITISASAGNSFFAQTATNVAPWILTVAASTVDRELQSNIQLGNSKIIKGFGLNHLNMEKASALIIGSDAAASGIPSVNASFCNRDTLNPDLIKGKIVVCQTQPSSAEKIQKGLYISNIGGIGMILIDPLLAKDTVNQFKIQTTVIRQEEAEELQAYIATAKNPVARIHQTITVLPVKPAPKMASFSSKGPNILTPNIIKPDITAPGVNILAAWSPVATARTNGLPIDYDIASGTSMACPHVSALAAVIKAYHPSWSPAAIMSAIMTTAKVTDNTGNYIRSNLDDSQATPFDYGSGHVNPVAAVDPGLIYDFDARDIIDFLCSYGASPAQLRNLSTGGISHCNNSSKPSYNFNYPSIGVSNMNGSLSVYRTVTYYGKGPTIYVSKLGYPNGVNVSVTPNVLRFRNAGEKMSFRLDFAPSKTTNGSFVFGALTWSNGIHKVRSPIALNVLSV